jgi:hypothetical protein
MGRRYQDWGIPAGYDSGMELPATELRAEGARALDLLGPEELAEVFAAADRQAVDAVAAARRAA